jgi:type II secretory pathway pseudopilin PulG
MRAGSRWRQGGFTYFGALFLLMLMGLGLAGTGEAWSLASRRARERELLWVGQQYARALKDYHDATPGQRQYPQKLEELVEDRRFPVPRHHLRRLYADPVTRQGFQVMLNAHGRIGGVRSTSQEPPLKQAGFPEEQRRFEGRARHADWEFIADLSLAPRNGRRADPVTGGKPAAP